MCELCQKEFSYEYVLISLPGKNPRKVRACKDCIDRLNIRYEAKIKNDQDAFSNE